MRNRIVPPALLVALLCVMAGSSGCTTEATKEAINNYHRSEDSQELAFNNTQRVAKQQMLYNLKQFVRANQADAERVAEAIDATWQAREQVEVSHVQFLLGRALSQLTVGQYLYDSQGALNALIGSKAEQANAASNAADVANSKAGIKSVTELIPGARQADTSSRPATRPSGPAARRAVQDFHDTLDAIRKK